MYFVEALAQFVAETQWDDVPLDVQRHAKLVSGVRTKALVDERWSESIEPGSHRRVRREQIARSRHGQCHVEGLPGFHHEVASPLQHGERRMPLVQMTDIRPAVERGEKPPPSDAQHHLLHQADVRSAAVQLAGDPSIRRRVDRVVAVEQVELHSSHLRLPCAQPHGAAG